MKPAHIFALAILAICSSETGAKADWITDLRAAVHFGKVKPLLTNAKGTQSKARGALHSVHATLEGGHLLVYIKTPVPTPGDLTYRFWLSVSGQTPPDLVVINPKATSVNVIDLKTKANLAFGIQSDLTAGLLAIIPVSKLPSKFAATKRLVVADFSSIEPNNPDKALDEIKGSTAVIPGKD